MNASRGAERKLLIAERRWKALEVLMGFANIQLGDFALGLIRI